MQNQSHSDTQIPLYLKCSLVLSSCNTLEQMKLAGNYFTLAFKSGRLTGNQKDTLTDKFIAQERLMKRQADNYGALEFGSKKS